MELEAQELDNPPELLADNPYDNPDLYAVPSEGVCGLNWAQQPGHYRLEHYANEEAAQMAGAQVTHRGQCGMCSSLQDLAVYIRTPDLTEPVRACGLESFGADIEVTMGCLEGLGFSEACAQIWAFNTRNTQVECLLECLAALESNYNEADGSLNPCLQCDEDQSGPVFKAVSGRTRRNSGLSSAICRPCTAVYEVEHIYE